MITTLVAVVCHALNAAPLCFEEIVTDTDISGITFMECQMLAPVGIAKWKGEHPIYSGDKWWVAKWKCVPGHYNVLGRA